MKVLINVAGARQGGAMHLAQLVIRSALNGPGEIAWSFAVSQEVYHQNEQYLTRQGLSVLVINKPPSSSFDARRSLARFARETCADAVFTPYGPAYVRFAAPHLLGVAVPWVTHPSLLAYTTKRFPDEWLQHWIRVRYRTHWFKKADYWWTETDTAKRGMVRRLGLPAEKIEVIPNTCGRHFFDTHTAVRIPDRDETLKLLYLTAPYTHKNIPFLAKIAFELKRMAPGRSFQMVTTISTSHPIFRRYRQLAARLGVEDCLSNLGPINVSDCPALYADCHAVLIPTLLETFSAAYPEAMAMQRPIITTNLDFAREACGDAAVYFDPQSAVDAASQIMRLWDSPVEWASLTSRGLKRLNELPTEDQKFWTYVSILRKLVQDD